MRYADFAAISEEVSGHFYRRHNDERNKANHQHDSCADPRRYRTSTSVCLTDKYHTDSLYTQWSHATPWTVDK